MASRTGIIVAVLVACCTLAIGVVVGYFVSQEFGKESCGDLNCDNSCVSDCQSAAEVASSCKHPMPRTYTAYHLNGKTINIDGDLNDAAWVEVPWTEDFVDLRGIQFPTPNKRTRAKLRWDDDNVYIAAHMEETDLWAKYTEHETHVWRDNAFEFFLDMDGSMHNYKELQINQLGITWDLMLTKGYLDGGAAVSSWNSSFVTAVTTDGVINDPNTKSTYWATEWSIPLSSLAQHNNRQNPTPSDGEIMFMNLQRPDWNWKIVAEQYVKDESLAERYWSWQTCDALNTHIPSRWGLMKFTKDAASVNPPAFEFSKWNIYRALFDTFEALQKSKATGGSYNSDLRFLDLPAYITEGNCVSTPVLDVVGDQFNVTIATAVPSSMTGHIRQDRLVWFD